MWWNGKHMYCSGEKKLLGLFIYFCKQKQPIHLNKLQVHFWRGWCTTILHWPSIWTCMCAFTLTPKFTAWSSGTSETQEWHHSDLPQVEFFWWDKKCLQSDHQATRCLHAGSFSATLLITIIKMLFIMKNIFYHACCPISDTRPSICIFILSKKSKKGGKKRLNQATGFFFSSFDLSSTPLSHTF